MKPSPAAQEGNGQDTPCNPEGDALTNGGRDPGRALNAWTAALAIMRSRWRRHFVLPNYTPARWWECDVFELTTAGYFREYEIKMSVADYRRDKDKNYDGRRGEWTESKHVLLEKGVYYGPCQFWFATPVGLLQNEPLPKWAGLIEIEVDGFGRLWPRQKTRARRLHRHKLDPRAVEHARSVCYYRYHELAQRR